MNYIGITILIITLVSMVLVCLTKLSKSKLFKSYWFYAIIAIFTLTYFLILRWWDSFDRLKEIIDIPNYKILNPYNYSFKWSKVLLLDLCPFVSVALPLSLIFDPTRNSSKVISLFALLGGLFTIFGSMIFINEIHVSLLTFLFIGESPNTIMFGSHYLMVVLSLFVLVHSKKFTVNSMLGVVLFAFFFILYVLIMTRTLGIECNATGLVGGDWTTPYPNVSWYCEYGALYKITKFPFPLNVLFWYSISATIIYLFIFIKNFFEYDGELCDVKDCTINLRMIFRYFPVRYKIFYGKCCSNK